MDNVLNDTGGSLQVKHTKSLLSGLYRNTKEIGLDSNYQLEASDDTMTRIIDHYEVTFKNFKALFKNSPVFRGVILSTSSVIGLIICTVIIMLILICYYRKRGVIIYNKVPTRAERNPAQDIPSQNRPSAPPLPTTPAFNQPPPIPVKQNQS